MTLPFASLPHPLPAEVRGASLALNSLDNLGAWDGWAAWERQHPPGAETPPRRWPPARERAYRAGRLCAQQALGALGQGHRAVQIGRRADGAPDWPPGIVGSITHTDHLACAAVVVAGRWRGLGLDSEAVPAAGTSTAADIAQLCATDQERRALGAAPDAVRATMLFSLKESVHKALAPVLGRRLAFDEVAVDTAVALSPSGCVVRLWGTEQTGADLAPLLPRLQAGGCLRGGLVHTWVLLAGD